MVAWQLIKQWRTSRASVIFMSSTLDKAAAITSPELVQLNQDLLKVANVCTSGTPVAAVFYKKQMQ
jgi:hypothetical protein